MARLIVSLAALSMLVASPVLAEETQDTDFAQYTASIGVSPFGGSLNLAYNFSRKNGINFALGGLPGGSMEVDIDGTNYDVESSSSWVGAFVQHRPFDSAEWFRLLAGIGIGSIENELTDDAGNRYSADYNGNPVGYVGIGFGNDATKGFQIGFDIGWLQTSGPDIQLVEGTADLTGAQALAATENIGDNLFFGNALPNAQLTLGWGF